MFINNLYYYTITIITPEKGLPCVVDEDSLKDILDFNPAPVINTSSLFFIRQEITLWPTLSLT